MSRRDGTAGLASTFSRRALVGITVGVVVLVLLDVVLVTVALIRTAPEEVGAAGPIPTFSASPRGAAASPTATPTADAPASDQAGSDAAARHLLTAVDGREAWRASSTTCSAAQVVLEHTLDGGATWRAVPLGGDVRAVTGMRATAEGLSILTRAGDDCDDTVFTTRDDGATWSVGTAGAAGAGISADGIVLGSGTTPSPCPEPVDAFSGERTTVVVCDGQVEWRSGAGSWVDVPLGGVRALGVDGNEYTLARVGTPSCDGVQIETMTAVAVTPETTTTPVGCNHVATSGPIALDRAGQDVWMWAGDDVAVSTDGGATW